MPRGLPSGMASMLSSGGRSACQFSKYAFSKSVSTKPHGSSPTHLVRVGATVVARVGVGWGARAGLGGWRSRAARTIDWGS